MVLLRRSSLLRVLCVFAVVNLACLPNLFAATEQVEIAGTVYASQWDANDNVTAVMIFTVEGDEVAVSKTGKGLELLKLEGNNVRATGMVATDENGTKTITVSSYVIEE